MKNDSVKLIILALLIIGVGYWYFFTGNDADPSVAISPTNQAQTQFQTLMSALPVSFDTSIFEDSRFLLLVDLSTPVTPEVSGRPDPFATITGITGQ